MTEVEISADRLQPPSLPHSIHLEMLFVVGMDMSRVYMDAYNRTCVTDMSIHASDGTVWINKQTPWLNNSTTAYPTQ
jgi:hypothetical protein